MDYQIKIGRPRVKIDLVRVKCLLSQGNSIKAVAEQLELKYITLWRRIDEDRRKQKEIDYERHNS